MKKRKRPTDDELRERLLSTWYKLNQWFKEYTTEDLERAIELELHGERRWTFLSRLQNHICRQERAARLSNLRRRFVGGKVSKAA